MRRPRRPFGDMPAGQVRLVVSPLAHVLCSPSSVVAFLDRRRGEAAQAALPPPAGRVALLPRDAGHALAPVSASRHSARVLAPIQVMPMLRPQVFERYIAPARQRPQFWRLVVGLALVVVFYAGFLALTGLTLRLLMSDAALLGALDRVSRGGDPITLLVLLASFSGLMLGTVVAARLMQGRGLASIIGPWRIALRDFFLGIGLALVAFAPAGLAWSGWSDLTPGLDPALWAALLPIALLGLIVQTGAEEALFRGYMLQQLAARFRSPLGWLILPSLAFGLVHYDPVTMGGNTWLVVASTGLFGLIAADLTARSGSLGLAWGLHFANNVYALLIVSMGGGLDGLALWRYPHPPDAAALRPLMALDMALLALIWLVGRFALRHRR
ncbi:CPBP family intramembrane metalloprotease domain-containing protein [Rhodobacteraceae bacterium WD3A24]|nr:CPBP family intramembrane metalloprotease domain-containing protein [Rhodobacteraceae bacterium WD3A24]